MAEVTQKKSRGLRFAQEQLLRHGWEHGKGLGKAENGISEAIKVKVKCDKGGVGHKEGEQFTFHWWDHVFNKASSSLQVESDQAGIKLKKTSEEGEDNGMISNKKPRKATLAKAKLYGCFVKSATLLSGQEQPEPKPTQSEDSSSSDEEEDEKLDLSSTTKLSDADLMKACGGRTAHKGARHGLTMSAKLARLEQQEAEFMAKYGKKSEPTSASTTTTSKSAELESESTEEMPCRKKMKKKSSGGSNDKMNGSHVSEHLETDVKAKNKKKKLSDEAKEISDSVDDVVFVKNVDMDFTHETKKKRKRRKNKEQNAGERTPSPPADYTIPGETMELHTDTKVKKRKKSKHQREDKETNSEESSQPEVVPDSVSSKTKAGKKKKKKSKD